MNCYHGEVCSADNRVIAKIKGCCNSFENKSEVLKLPYTVGKTISVYSPVQMTEEMKQLKIIQALIAYKASLNTAFLDDIQSLYNFVAEIRDEIHDRKTSDFMKSNGTINDFDPVLSLPFTTNIS